MTPKKEPERMWGDGRAVVLAHADAIREWVEGGRTMRSYHKAHQEALGISYVQFTRLCRSYIQAEPPRPKGSRNDKQATTTSTRKTSGTSTSKPSRAETASDGTTNPSKPFGEFRHNPIAGDLDDLI